jgi:ribonucleoside-diphosphate reductase alpha chain
MINGETDPDQVFHDIAEELARVENPKVRAQVQASFERIMTEGYFIPGGRIMANARTYTHAKSRNYNNCFTIDIEDNMEGIYGAVYEDAMISRMGGGVGFDVSKLRPEGSKTTNGGEASGPISFLRVFDASAKTISSGGHRRAAHIALLDIDHPDILKFITVKQGDKDKKLSQFNISVRITDAFMKAVEDDADWQLKFKGVVYQTIKARELYLALAKNAFTHNDPGVFFMDTVERDNNGWWAFKMDRCNPSLRKGTRVLTREGILPIEELEGKTFEVRNLNQQWSPAKCFLSGKNKPLYRLTFEDGTETYSTAEHKWPIAVIGGGYSKVETRDLLEGNYVAYADSRKLEIESPPDLTRDRGFMLGWLYGDGWFTYSEGSDRKDSVASYGFCFNASEKYLGEKVLTTLNEIKGGLSDSTLNFRNGMFYIDGTSHKDLRKFIQDRCGATSKEHLPKIIWSAGDEFIEGFIDGLMSADSYVSFAAAARQGELVFTNKHETLIQELRELLGFYGLRSEVTTQIIPGETAFPEVKACQGKEYTSHTLRFNLFYTQKFGRLFSLSHKGKQESLDRIANLEYKNTQFSGVRARNIKIASVELTELQEDVWDISVDDYTHCFQLSNSITGNCVAGESRVEFRLEDGPITTAPICDLVTLYKNLKPEEHIYVRSYDEKTNKDSWNLLQGAGLTKKDAELLHITDEDTGRAIRCTPDHEILTKRGWVKAKDLLVEDQIIQA